MEEEGLAKIPDLNIAQWIFTLKTNPVCNLYKTLLTINELYLLVGYRNWNKSKKHSEGAPGCSIVRVGL